MSHNTVDKCSMARLKHQQQQQQQKRFGFYICSEKYFELYQNLHAKCIKFICTMNFPNIQLEFSDFSILYNRKLHNGPKR